MASNNIKLLISHDLIRKKIFLAYPLAKHTKVL